MKEKCYYVYLTTNLLNQKKYIGYHYGFVDDNYLGSGANLQKDILQYGKHNFKKEILELCSNSQECFQREKYWIAYYNAVESDEFYNIDRGGEGGWIGAHKYWVTHKQEQEQILEKARQINQTKPKTDKQMQASNANLKKAQLYWKEHNDELADLLKQIRPNAVEARRKKIRCITTGEVFESVHAAEVKYNIYKGGVSRCALGKMKKGWVGIHPITGEKLRWEYIDGDI